jgi:hypothetical protein
MGPQKNKFLEVIGTMTMREKRGMQWDRLQIRVPERGSGPLEKNIKNDKYHDDRGEERNPMG